MAKTCFTQQLLVVTRTSLIYFSVNTQLILKMNLEKHLCMLLLVRIVQNALQS